MENKDDLSILINYAFCGPLEIFINMLNYLSNMAEQEIWTFDEENPLNLLRKYIYGTFSQCYNQNKILVSADGNNSCFNTGLLTPNGSDIIALFVKNNREGAQPWVLKGFKDISDREYMNLFSVTPKLATYTDNFEDFYFNPELELIINIDHILDDNWERIHSIVPYSKNIVKALLHGVIDETKKKIKRNIRLVVPQYYNKKIMYLMPIKLPISDDTYVTMALAVEKANENQYRANTIFTKEMAYEKARLLMKPESNWLIE